MYYLDKTYNSPQFTNSPRGNNSKEILSVSFAITNPVQRVCYIPERKSNIIFNFAEALWYLTGNNSLEYISYYASNMKRYSLDGKTLTGTAYGPKIFSYGMQDINQWDRIIRLFREDPDTKRAFLSIFDANEDLSLANIDVSCTLGLHFLLRNHKLYMSAFMRANDAYRGVVSDVFSFTLIHEFMARQLSLDVGDYYHNVSTYHVYEPDYVRAKQLLQTSFRKPANYYFPSMPQKDNWSDLMVVAEYEQQLRLNQRTIGADEISKLKIDEYWKQVIFLFAVYNSIQYKDAINIDYYHRLAPVFSYLVKNRWNKELKEGDYNGNKLER